MARHPVVIYGRIQHMVSCIPRYSRYRYFHIIRYLHHDIKDNFNFISVRCGMKKSPTLGGAGETCQLLCCTAWKPGSRSPAHRGHPCSPAHQTSIKNREYTKSSIVQSRARVTPSKKNAYLQKKMQCCGSGSVLEPYSGAFWIRIRIPHTDSHV